MHGEIRVDRTSRPCAAARNGTDAVVDDAAGPRLPSRRCGWRGSAASFRSCVTSSTVGFRVIQRSCMTPHSSSRVNWSSAPNGSSSIRSCGSWISARQSDARCSMPPESCQGYLLLKPASPTCASSASISVAEFAFALGAILLTERRHDLQRQHHVVEQREPRQQRRVLERHADAHRLRADLRGRRHRHSRSTR